MGILHLLHVRDRVHDRHVHDDHDYVHAHDHDDDVHTHESVHDHVRVFLHYYDAHDGHVHQNDHAPLVLVNYFLIFPVLHSSVSIFQLYLFEVFQDLFYLSQNPPPLNNQTWALTNFHDCDRERVHCGHGHGRDHDHYCDRDRDEHVHDDYGHDDGRDHGRHVELFPPSRMILE
jgi:hypothetical protein